jgi:glutamyl endopeptidase
MIYSKILPSVALVSILALGSGAAFAQGRDRPVADGPVTRTSTELAPASNGEIAPFMGSESSSRADLTAAGVEFLSVDGPAPLSDLVQGLMSEAEAAESILGWDSRMRMQTTAAMANRATGLITIGTNNAHLCTGWLYAPHMVATAGHCVHTGGSSGAWRDRRTMRFWPGRDGTSAPYGSCTVARLHSVLGWTRDGNALYDYGAMRLNCTVGNTVGWFGMYALSANNAMNNQPAIITGYPGDRAQQQWLSADKVRVSEALRLCYRMDTIGGHSGSPIFHDRSEALSTNGPWAIAVHAYGAASSGTCPSMNWAPRLTGVRINNYISWRNL